MDLYKSAAGWTKRDVQLTWDSVVTKIPDMHTAMRGCFSNEIVWAEDSHKMVRKPTSMPVLTVYEVLKLKGLRSKHEQLEVANPVAPGVD